MRPLLTESGSAELEITTAVANSISQGQCALVLTGSGPGVAIGDAVSSSFPDQVTVVSDVCATATEQFLQTVAQVAPDLVIGIGGGSVIERMKVAAHQAGCASMAVPTSLSQDGLFAPSAVLKLEDGTTRRYNCSAPTMVIPARSLIETAPAWTREACVADVLSNFSAVADCGLSIRNGRGGPTMEALDLAVQAARLAAAADPDDSAMALFKSVKLSGQAMTISGDSRPCSGAEHKIAHAIDEVTGQPAVHGLAVGVATVFVTNLRNDHYKEEVLKAFSRQRVPTTPEQIGVTIDDFVEAVLLARTQRPSRFTILDVVDLDASSIRRIANSPMHLL